MTQHEQKKAAAEAAMAYIEDDMVVGVGTGSTVNFFIDALKQMSARIDGAVSSSDASETLLRERGIPVMDLNNVDEIAVYVDGADEADPHLRLI
ncbi:MAG: ribose 5-phosphate isomerase A, partial [Gammaproteobacteria bacterium]